MSKDKFEVILLELPNKTCPVMKFIKSLDKKMSAKIFGLMDILAEVGNDLREPYSKNLGDGIFELRAKISSDVTRVLYFFCVGRKIVITNGFVKKTNKTPQSEIQMAKKYRDLYLKEHNLKR